MRKLVVVLVAMALVGVVWFVVNKDSDPGDQSAVPAQAPLTPGGDQQFSRQTARIESALVSRNAATARSVWVSGDTPPIAPKGTVVTIDDRTFVARKDAGRVEATVRQPGKDPITCRLLLQRKGSKWLVYAMEEVK